MRFSQACNGQWSKVFCGLRANPMRVKYYDEDDIAFSLHQVEND